MPTKQPYNQLKISRLSYDSEKETASFGLSGVYGGKPCSVSGFLRVPTPGDQTESQVKGAAKEAIAKFLRLAADSL